MGIFKQSITNQIKLTFHLIYSLNAIDYKVVLSGRQLNI